MKHELDAVAAQQRVADSHIPTPERKEERPAMTDDKDVSALTFVGAGAAPSAIQEARAILDGTVDREDADIVLVARAYIESAEWRTMESALKDGSRIWAYTTEGDQRIVFWEEESPSAPDDPGHHAGWMSDGGETHPSCIYYGFQPAADPPLRWKPAPEPELSDEDFNADGALPEPSKGQAPTSSSKVTI